MSNWKRNALNKLINKIDTLTQNHKRYAPILKDPEMCWHNLEIPKRNLLLQLLIRSPTTLPLFIKNSVLKIMKKLRAIIHILNHFEHMMTLEMGY